MCVGMTTDNRSKRRHIRDGRCGFEAMIFSLDMNTMMYNPTIMLWLPLRNDVTLE